MNLSLIFHLTINQFDVSLFHMTVAAVCCYCSECHSFDFDFDFFFHQKMFTIVFFLKLVSLMNFNGNMLEFIHVNIFIFSIYTEWVSEKQRQFFTNTVRSTVIVPALIWFCTTNLTLWFTACEDNVLLGPRPLREMRAFVHSTFVRRKYLLKSDKNNNKITHS